MTDPPAADLAFRARALAQAHPLSAAVQRIVNRAVADEGRAQPLQEAGVWAGAALTQGYCLRKVEEALTGIASETEQGLAVGDDELERIAAEVAADLRQGSGDDVTVAALDLLVGSQVEHRLDQWRDEVDASAWHELEQYLTWWVVKGYALRRAEMPAAVR